MDIFERILKASELYDDNRPGLNDGGRIGFKGGYKVEDMTSEEIKAAQGNARKKGYSGKINSEEFKNFLANEYRSRAEQLEDFKKLKQKNLKEYQNKFDIDKIKAQTTPLLKSQKDKLYPTYDNIFREEYVRLASTGDPFSRTDLGRAVINRIEAENPTINLSKGIGLDKLPGGGNYGSKTLFDIINGRYRKNKLFSKKELSAFTQGNETDAIKNTKNLKLLFDEILSGNNDANLLSKKFNIETGRLEGRVEKLMRNLSKTNKADQYAFLKKYKEKDLEKVRNNIYESETLNNSYQRTIIQSVLESTKLGSKERKQAFEKLDEFNKFKKVMFENGIDPKLLALDHAASYRAIKNGNLKNFLAVTPVISDINTLKSTFDRRSQLNLRRMKDYLLAGDNKNYKYFLKNQTELENLWKTMTGGQSSLGKIRVTATGPRKGEIKIFDYGSTSLLDKNKDLLDELSNNIEIRKNIVNASSVDNLNEARRIMLAGSELTEKKMLGTMKKTDRSPKTVIDQSFKNLNDPQMFKAEKQISNLLAKMGCPGKGKAMGGRIELNNGSSPEVCMKRGADVIKEKRIDSPSQKANFNKMMKVASTGKNMALLKDVLGPYGLGGDVLLEGMIAINKTLTGGTPFKESWQDSWLSSIVGGAYDDKGQKLGREKLLELRSGLSGGAQEFGDYNRKVNEYYNLIDQRNNLGAFTNLDEFSDTSAEVKQINNKIKAAERELGRMETRINAQGGFEAVQNEYNRKTIEQKDTDAAKSLQSIGRLYVDQNNLNQMLQDDFSGLSSDALPMQKQPRPTLPSYETFKPEIPTLPELKTAYQEANFIPPDDRTLEQNINQERFRQLFEQPGFMGASDTFFGDSYRYSNGGIAGLSGGVDKGPAPESGPASDGLLKLFKRVRNY